MGSLEPESKCSFTPCWNSDCVVQFGSHCAEHWADPFLRHVRGRIGKHCQSATPISLPRRPFWHRCGCLSSPDHFFPAGASLRPSVSQMLRRNGQNNTPSYPHLTAGRTPESCGTQQARCMELRPMHSCQVPVTALLTASILALLTLAPIHQHGSLIPKTCNRLGQLTMFFSVYLFIAVNPLLDPLL